MTPHWLPVTAQVRELEAELENEQRKSRDAIGAAKRFERQWKEVRVTMHYNRALLLLQIICY